MFLHVIRAEYIREHRIHLWFSDGFDGEADLSAVLTGPLFEPLLDVATFTKFQTEGHTLGWPNGADFAPEYLRELARSLTPA